MAKSQPVNAPTAGEGNSTLSRRGMLGATAAASAAIPLVAGSSSAETADSAPDPRSTARLVVSINQQTRVLQIDPRMSLLDVLRDRLGLTGTKKGCDHGQCGACTVLIDGERALACLTLAIGVRAPVTTIEGVTPPDGALHPMQQAFIDQDAFQCGYCTPGQILSAIACVEEGHAKTDDEIREYMSGNLCRCAAYPHIVAAINQAKAQMPPRERKPLGRSLPVEA
jgi:xanthine dehydrogenase YagT iron-sulfur-binding subunit